MIVDVLFVGMGRHQKRVSAFGKPHGQLVSDLVRFFRRDLARPEGLPDLVGNDIVFLPPSGLLLILPLAPFPILMDKKSFVIMERKGVQMMENKRKKGTPPPRYDDAFKAGAVRMVIEQGRPSAEVAKELGICIDTLRSWLKAAGVQPGQTDRQNRDNRKMRDLEAEVRALRKQLAEKDEVIDILKKSVGILSKP